MAYITIDQAIRASEDAGLSRSAAESEIRKSAASSMDTEFGIFMSHSYEDAKVITGIKRIVEKRTGLSVYVDWIEDAQMDRSDVTPQTASVLRQRMRHCQFMLYATSRTSSNSRWMPWELGYFDGLRENRVGILPIAQTSSDSFSGQEYLGLYPFYEVINFIGIGKSIGRFTSGTRQGVRLVTEAQSAVGA